jgi:glycosyltransferase involved in cell wall biosynthesis
LRVRTLAALLPRIETTLQYEHDLSAVPIHPLDPTMTVELLSAETVGSLSEIGPIDFREIRERVARGDRCYLVRHESGRLVHHAWVQRSGRHYIQPAGIRQLTQEGQAWIYDCRTREDMQGRHIYRHVLGIILSDLRRDGARSAQIYTRLANVASQRGIAAADFVPSMLYWSLRAGPWAVLLSSKRLHSRESNSKSDHTRSRNGATVPSANRKLRILHVIDAIGNAGAETLLRTFAESIDPSRFELHICGLRPRPGSVTVPALETLGIRIVQFNQRASYDLPTLAPLVGYVRKEKIDLIHTHLLAGDVMGRLAGFLTRTPVISMMHSGREDLDQEPQRRQQLERWTARLWCRKLVVVSDLVRKELAAWFGIPPDRVVAIPNGVNTERFQTGPDFDRAIARSSLIGGDFPLVTNVGRLVPVKGQRYLVEAASMVVAKHPQVRFLVVGEGEMQAGLAELAAELGIGSNVILTGFRADIAAILAASDAFALSSLSEGMPVALLEAMAAGCPVVATDVGGVSQLVHTGVTGMLVPPADGQALAEALLVCLDDPERAKQMGAAGQRLVIQEFSMREWARKWEDLYLSEIYPRTSSNATKSSYSKNSAPRS